jgi:signal transduction histidine kinase
MASWAVFRLAWWRQLPHYFWVSWLLLALLAALYWVSRPAAVPGVFSVTQAEVFAPGNPSVATKQVALPHILDDEGPDWWGRVDYIIPWPAELQYSNVSGQRLAVLLPRVGTRFRVLLNHQEIYNVGWYLPPERTINTAWFPYLVTLPEALLRSEASSNLLQIEVEAELLERSGLSPLQIGHHDLLLKRYHQLELWQVTGTWMMTITALLMGLLSVFLWVSLREKLFLLMAAASLAHAVRLLFSVLLDPGMPFEWYFFLHRVAFTLYVGFFCLFIEDLFGLKLRIVRALSWFLLLVGPLWMVLILVTRDYDYYRIWAACLATVAFVSLSVVMWRTRFGRDLDKDQILLMVVSGFTLLTGIRDFLVVQLNFAGDADIRWMSMGSLVLMFTLGWVLVQRATASVREVHRLNDSLAETVSRREAELRQAFDRLRQIEQQRAVEGERRRLMRDMHDGLGSQLVQTLNMVRSRQSALDPHSVESMIHHALEELRLTLDSLEPMEGDLPTILGTLRQRVAPALEAAGIELDWQVQEVPPLEGLDSRGVMHLFRCVQEVFANVAKHARATKVTVRTWFQDGAVHLAVEDNGVGFTDAPDRLQKGRGLGNLRVRATALGAQVRFYNAQPGAGVAFDFPLPQGPTSRFEPTYSPAE